MKTLLTTIAALVLTSYAFAEPGVKLAWDYDATSIAMIDRFVIYLGLESGNYTEAINVDPPFDSATVGEVITTKARVVRPGAVYFVAVTASAGGVESEYSNEIQFRMPGKPVNLKK